MGARVCDCVYIYTLGECDLEARPCLRSWIEQCWYICFLIAWVVNHELIRSGSWSEEVSIQGLLTCCLGQRKNEIMKQGFPLLKAWTRPARVRTASLTISILLSFVSTYLFFKKIPASCSFHLHSCVCGLLDLCGHNSWRLQVSTAIFDNAHKGKGYWVKVNHESY